jgi:hypothetical protein
MSAFRSGTAAFGLPGGIAAASAAALATGAQIAKIASTSYGGSLAPTGMSAPAALPSGGMGGGSMATQQQQAVNITLQGEFFDRKTVQKLIDQFGQMQARGAR